MARAGQVPSDARRYRLSAADRKRLERLHDRLDGLRRRSIGYPCNQEFDYAELAPFLDFAINNVGDPFRGSNFALNTHEFEREVVETFARWASGRQGEVWGYVTNGGTEGNMYGLYLARELHPDGIVYFSEATHYSVAKVLRLQNMRNIMVRCDERGEIDYDDLRATIAVHRDVPPIVLANVGTTMTGAVDDLSRISGLFDELAIREHYVHVDAALSGMILPFVERPQPWSFADGADSISISGHKLIGGPVPCGVVLARQVNVDRVARAVEYVGAHDTTISGSRSALSPLILWMAIHKHGEAGLRGIVQESLGYAAYAVERLQEIGVPAWRHPNSITVVFPRPPEALHERWVIAPYRDIGHVITLPHATRDVIDEFVADFRAVL